ncbi:MAG: hypothetical protein Q7U99_23230 [Rubrivivax sp.]|nr:hypothetical protein [Rubrivivax sp.]MDP3226086.1 hypothetical protein [Rubrivivax sp.]
MAEPRLKKTRASPAHSWAVGKTMQVDTPGAVRLTRKYGDALVCVRYRISPDGSERITTVELEVDRVAVQHKANPLVAVKIYASETGLITLARAKGARYNGKTRLWRMHQNDAHALSLGARIARPQSKNRNL